MRSVGDVPRASFSVLFLPFSRPAKTADPPPPAAAFQTRLMSRACLVVPLVINLARTVEQREEEEEEEEKEELTFALNSIPLSLFRLSRVFDAA